MTISTIGLELAKSVFQIHGVDAAGTVMRRAFHDGGGDRKRSR